MKIVIPGVPIAKQRHRCGCRGGKPFSYDPQLESQAKSVKTLMLSSWNRAFESENKKIVMEASNLAKATSFSVTYTFLFPINKTDSSGLKNAKLWGFQQPNVKPDLDNLEKFYSDCATGILWDDDCRVTVMSSRKCYSENPRTEIEIMVKQDLKLTHNAQMVLEVFGPTTLKEFLKDVHEFMQFPSERVDEMVGSNGGLYKETALTFTAGLLADFAAKYGDRLKKIQKFKGINEETVRNDDQLSAMECGELNISDCERIKEKIFIT